MAVSHRWELKEDPDPDGYQLHLLQTFLAERPHLEYVFYDYVCLPQEKRGASNPEARALFEQLLQHMNLLYQSAEVTYAIVSDDGQMRRGWVYFECAIAQLSGNLVSHQLLPYNATLDALAHHSGGPVPQVLAGYFNKDGDYVSPRERAIKHYLVNHLSNCVVTNGADIELLQDKVRKLNLIAPRRGNWPAAE